MKFNIPKAIIILGVFIIIADLALKSYTRSSEFVNPWFLLVIGFDLYFLDKAKSKTIVYIAKIKDYPIEKLMAKRIKF